MAGNMSKVKGMATIVVWIQQLFAYKGFQRFLIVLSKPFLKK